MQLISQMQQIFDQTKCGLITRTYEILATGRMSGLLEVAIDAYSIHNIKEKVGGDNPQLIDYFKLQFGPSMKT
jgi:phosphatidylinositol kinase/protein kinase (PI-3  family)